jgi:dsRNA-specific ribonuclease
MDSTKQLSKGQNSLKILCKRNSYKKPKYEVISQSSDGYREYYKVKVEVKDQLIVFGCGISKRIARKNAAIIAHEKLLFKKCGEDSVSELIKFCTDKGFRLPVCDEEYDGETYKIKCTVTVPWDTGDIQLLGIENSDSYRMAKIAAAKNVIKQLKDIDELQTNEIDVNHS